LILLKKQNKYVLLIIIIMHCSQSWTLLYKGMGNKTYPVTKLMHLTHTAQNSNNTPEEASQIKINIHPCHIDTQTFLGKMLQWRQLSLVIMHSLGQMIGTWSDEGHSVWWLTLGQMSDTIVASCITVCLDRCIHIL